MILPKKDGDIRKILLTIYLVVWCARPLASAGGQDRVSSEPKWEIEVHAGGRMTNLPTSGSTALPGPGPAFTTDIRQPSRLVSSWLFGDGGQLLNEVVG